MRIQHNVMALNSFRNYNNNTSALSSNLEKLSSGYRINRAGDDAAGLAISEKMRAQITGLDAAQKNVADGISLVKTAEGALQEVQDMMNRMVYLAEQSANGTYDDTVDRAALQDEVNALMEEIDRIAESANFNGTKLLDGSLAGGIAGTTTTVSADLSKFGIDLTSNATDVNPIAGVYKTTALAGGADVTLNETDDRANLTVSFTDSDGVEQTVDISLFINSDGELRLDDGTTDGKKLTATSATGTSLTKTELGAALKEALEDNDLIKANFTVANTDDALTLTAKTKGTSGAVLNDVTFTSFDNSTKDTSPNYGVTTYANKVDVDTEATDTMKAYDFATDGKIWDGSLTEDNGNLMAELEDAIFEINGEKFVFVNSALSNDDLAELESAGVEHWVVVGSAGSIKGSDLSTMVEKIKKETGLQVEQGTNSAAGAWTAGTADANVQIIIKNGTKTTEGTEGNALTLQIGDTSDDYNQLAISIDSMKCADILEGGKIDISEQGLAQSAIDSIKDSINAVSAQRGKLGAIQNRLEHTQNNLSVMEENITNAESTIRDTDIADEMTAYTKNNILLQSAQAMLAQANQVPQGVLQLLQ